MLVLPSVPPVTGFTTRVELPRDYYVRMGSNDYSVHPQAIDRFVEVTADLESVTISLEGRSVGTHPGPGAPARPLPTRNPGPAKPTSPPALACGPPSSGTG